MGDANISKRKAKYVGMDVSETKRLKLLEDENTRLKRLVADSMLDNAALKDQLGKMVTPAAKREPLNPPNRANPTARAKSELDKSWGQGQRHHHFGTGSRLGKTCEPNCVLARNSA